MPRDRRPDAPRVLHHVIARGLGRHATYRDDRDPLDFLGRLAGRIAAGAVTIDA